MKFIKFKDIDKGMPVIVMFNIDQLVQILTESTLGSNGKFHASITFVTVTGRQLSRRLINDEDGITVMNAISNFFQTEGDTVLDISPYLRIDCE